MERLKNLMKNYITRRNLRNFFHSQTHRQNQLVQDSFQNLQKSQTSLFVQRWSQNNITQIYLECLERINKNHAVPFAQVIDNYVKTKTLVKRLLFQCGVSSLSKLISSYEYVFQETVYGRTPGVPATTAFLMNDLNQFIHIVSFTEEKYNDERHHQHRNSPFWFEEIPTLGHHTQEKYQGVQLCIPIHSNNQRFLRIRIITLEDPSNLLHRWDYVATKLGETQQILRDTANIPARFRASFIQSLSVKRLLLNTPSELSALIKQNYIRYVKYRTQTMSALVKSFLTSQPQIQADTLACFLLDEQDLSETQIHTAFLLQDMVCGDSQLSQQSGTSPAWTAQGQAAVDLQKLIHFQCRKHLKSFKSKTLTRMKRLTETNEQEMNIEQQLQILDVSDNVRRKAFERQKEGMSRNNESAQKALAWVQNLLKIPFGSQRREPCLVIADECVTKIRSANTGIVPADTHMSLNAIDNALFHYGISAGFIEEVTGTPTRHLVDAFLAPIQTLRPIADMAARLGIKIRKNTSLNRMRKEIGGALTATPINSLFPILKDVSIDKLPDDIKTFMTSMWAICETRAALRAELRQQRQIMEYYVQAQEEVKKETMRIVGQWMTGENTGYCLGFEGPPGVGKTTLAKEALAQILHDADGNKRPFKFIALGGGSNGSTLEGHNQTQVGSAWGQIVDALMEANCLNPILQFDELDKVSKTEHGREIIGILTHLTDPSQNTQFQDKQFQGVPIDLSKALIIFSQNDPAQIDPILLDRIHRIQFRPLTTSQKIVISKNYLVPNIQRTIGLSSHIRISDENYRRIVDLYTNECGVRALKEYLQSILREQNLQQIEAGHREAEIGWDFVESVLEKEVPELRRQCDGEAKVGSITGMQATKQSGGTMPIQCVRLDGRDDFELTGNQGAVMKESMKIARSVTLRLQEELVSANRISGIIPDKIGWHIHVPDGATPKDGPSGGFAITMAMLSAMTGMGVRDDQAFTGEIDLAGNIRAIGGLDKKFAGAVAHGVTKVFIPDENYKDVAILEKDPIFCEDVLDHLEICFVRNIRDGITEIFSTDTP